MKRTVQTTLPCVCNLSLHDVTGRHSDGHSPLDANTLCMSFDKLHMVILGRVDAQSFAIFWNTQQQGYVNWRRCMLAFRAFKL